MSDLKKDNEIKEIYLVESDESSTEAQNCGVTIQNVIKEVVQASASEQFENVLDSNKAVITNRNIASEMLQTKEIGQEGMTGSLMPHESVQAPTNELPRNAERREDFAAASSQPSRRRCRRSTRATSINNAAAEGTGPRRSARIKDQNEGKPRREGLRASYDFLAKRPLYKDNKRDEYAWFSADYSSDED